MKSTDETRSPVSRSRTEQSNKREYQTPQLQVYGDIHELTLNAAGSGTDAVQPSNFNSK
jgi:hypothetical protein